MPNHLANATSLYLQLHAEQLVDWYPWGDEATKLARYEHRPIFLSIGYSSCHWCHVMARETFADPEIAIMLNADFVCIKVDREERPDVDALYMASMDALGMGGGWPLNVIMTPEGIPFAGGTYFPPTARHGHSSFSDMLRDALAVFRDPEFDPAGVRDALTDHLISVPDEGEKPEYMSLVFQGRTALHAFADPMYGGFGMGAKFPSSSALSFLHIVWWLSGDAELDPVLMSGMTALINSGMHDLVGGGFHRYTVDRAWRMPHFEKMLYDTALIGRLFTAIAATSGDAEIGAVVRTCVTSLLDDFRLPNGLFAASFNAEINGHEGTTYTWTEAELRDALPPVVDADAWVAWLGVGTPEGSGDDGRSVLCRMSGAPPVNGKDWQMVMAALRACRARRPQPRRDARVIVSWNAYAIEFLADCGRLCVVEEALTAAIVAGEALAKELFLDGVLVHALPTSGEPIPLLEDASAVLNAWLSLFTATGEAIWMERATAMLGYMRSMFVDPVRGYVDSATRGAIWGLQLQTSHDASVPSPMSAAARGLLRMDRLTGNPDLQRDIEGILRSGAEGMHRSPRGSAAMLEVAALVAAESGTAVVVNPKNNVQGPLATQVLRLFAPTMEIVPKGMKEVPIAHEMVPQHNRETVYICHGFTCEAPITDEAMLTTRLSALRPRHS